MIRSLPRSAGTVVLAAAMVWCCARPAVRAGCNLPAGVEYPIVSEFKVREPATGREAAVLPRVNDNPGHLLLLNCGPGNSSLEVTVVLSRGNADNVGWRVEQASSEGRRCLAIPAPVD